MVNGTKIILPGQAARQPQQQRQDQKTQIYTMIRAIEDARQKSHEDCCACIIAAIQRGWAVIIDETVPDGRATVTIANNFTRSLQQPRIHTVDNIIRLGKLYRPAIETIRQTIALEQKAQAGGR